jgi:hypothetical protein
MNGGMTDEQGTGKDLEESGDGLIEVLYQQLPGGTVENIKITSQNS